MRYPDVKESLCRISPAIKTFLKIRSFDADSFPQLVDKALQQIKGNLILDLRDNQGGAYENARYLLAKLCTQPVNYLQEKNLIRPAKDHFKGNIYVLINGGSFSNAAIVSACLQNAHRAVFIGEETGGNKYVISGNTELFELPYTHIRAFISTTSLTITNEPDQQHGVLPDYPTTADNALQKALQLIAQNR